MIKTIYIRTIFVSFFEENFVYRSRRVTAVLFDKKNLLLKYGFNGIRKFFKETIYVHKLNVVLQS